MSVLYTLNAIIIAISLSLKIKIMNLSSNFEKLLAEDIELPPAETRAVLVKLNAALLDLGSYGLAQTSRATLDQLDALTISLHNARLPRLERLAQTIRTQVAEYQAKSPNFDPAEYGRLVAEAGLISSALHNKLENPSELSLRELAGEVRSSYLEVEALEVQCLGAEGWRSDSGYAGATLYFYELAVGRWLTLSNVQPLMYGYFDSLLHQLYDKRPSLENRPLSYLAHSACTLLQPKVNRAGRLSSSAATKTRLKEKELSLSHKAFDRIRAHSWQKLVAGFDIDSETDGQRNLWLLEPASYSQPRFDEIERRWQMGALDEAGRWLSLEIESLPHTRTAINRLERFYERDRLPDYLLAEVWTANARLCARPISAGWKGGALLANITGPQLVAMTHLNLEAALPLESLPG